MAELKISELVEATGGSLVQGEPEARVDSYVINTRALRPGGVFFALRGGRTDGHRFLADAVRRQAHALVVSDALPENVKAAGAVIRVEDTATALASCGRFARGKLSNAKWFGLTGSNGKTTTKELLAEGLSAGLRVHRTQGNLNNHLGVPLSILACPADAECVVLELAMNAPGEIAALTAIADPDFGLVTNVRAVHLEFFHSLDDIAAAKGELFAVLRDDAVSVVNLDDPHVRLQATRHAGPRITFGSHPAADLRLEEVVNRFFPGAALKFRYQETSYTVQLQLGGAHSALNALAALAGVAALGAPLEPAIERMERLRPGAGRGALVRLRRDIRLIDDSYNSSPSALASVLETLRLTENRGRKVLVMGDMLELGHVEGALHREAGKRAAAAGIQMLVTVGSLSRQAAETARRAGVPEVHHHADANQCAASLAEYLRDGDLVLVKGSRSVRLERIIEALVQQLGGERLMLYHLLYPLHHWVGAFNVFQYITFRTALATLSALLVSLLLGPWMIRKLRQIQISQEIRQEGPSSHQAKRGTPTMGGLLILIAVVTPTLLWADLRNVFVWTAVGATVAFGAIGFADDYIKVVRRRSLGLTARSKFALQVLVALALGTILLELTRRGLFTTTLSLPFFKTINPDLGWGYPLFTVLVLAGSANAVNLTDGLDGLAIGSSLVVWGTFTLLAYVAGNAIAAEYLAVPNVKGAGELTIFCGAVVGSSLGFLWFNSHPAEVFMGDVGSMALGGALGTTALLIKQEMLLVLAGGLFVVEASSVIVQVLSFKLRGRRVFRMSPLHHHFELAGWSESKVVIRFWILAVLFSLLALATLKLR